jgi:hypothetical protein
MKKSGILLRVHARAGERHDAPRGGLLAPGLWFVPSATAMRVVPLPPVARVPAAPPELLGIALVEGEVIGVVALGEAHSAIVLCDVAGETVGLVGAEPVVSGDFEADPDPAAGGVEYHGERARNLDLSALLARVQGGATARW